MRLIKYDDFILDIIINAYDGKTKIRSSDRRYFNFWLGKDYMKGKEIHHDWYDGGRCYIFIR